MGTEFAQPERLPPAEPKIRRGRGSLSREEILQAAVDIVQEEGVEKLSMRRIAARLGCSVASPYAYFKSQRELVKVIIMRGEAALTADLKRARASSDDVFDQLEAIASTYWNFSREYREMHKLMFNSGGGKLYRDVFTSLPTSYRVFLETIRDGIRSGSIAFPMGSYSAIARTMWSWMYGLILTEMTGMLRYRKGDDPVQEGIRFFTILLRGKAQEKSPE